MTVIDKIYKWFIYHKILSDLHDIKMAVIDSQYWYEKRNIYRECVDLEMMAYKRYHGNFDNLFISEMFCQVARLESLLKESVKNE